jgi:hypothetical protein
MPDFREVAKQVEQDATAKTIKVFDRQGKPYLAPDGKTPATISFIGSESDEYRKMRDDVQRKAAESSIDTIEVAAAARIEIAARAAKSWTGWGKTVDDEPPCTVENVSALLSVEHILHQAEAGIGRRSGPFVDASSS